jgi:MtfA peptidase
MKKEIKVLVPLALFFAAFFCISQGRYHAGAVFIQFFLFTLVMVIVDGVNSTKRENKGGVSNSSKTNIVHTAYHTYYGKELSFSNLEITDVLNKRFPYFNALSQIQKTRFIERLQNFIANKIFKVHDSNGYKEMPILISAAAIQLTFGLKKYLLPNFEFIHVYPQEFLRIRETICFLEGNVSGHAINLSWKHFLAGYAQSDDGQNVGLHEMAHALYYQTFVVEKNADKNFRDLYDGFINDGNKVYHTEKTVDGGLYSEYAIKNFQEFWAESVEIFFEKPAAMKDHYPELYETIKFLLNQDPHNKIASVFT